jgi:hypothetical protein
MEVVQKSALNNANILIGSNNFQTIILIPWEYLLPSLGAVLDV